MSVRIRLRRVGRKKQPSYRLVVAEATSPREGAYLDTVGFYNPRSEPVELRVDLQKVDDWVERGAELTDTAASLVRRARRTQAAAPAPEAAAPAVEPEAEAPKRPRRTTKAKAEPAEPESEAQAEPESEAPAEA